MNVTYVEASPELVMIDYEGRFIGQFSLLSRGWKFMWLGDTWSRVSATRMTEIQQAIRDKQYMLSLTTKLTR